MIILDELIKLLLAVFFSNSNEIPVKASINVSKYFVTTKFPGYIKPEIKEIFLTGGRWVIIYVHPNNNYRLPREDWVKNKLGNFLYPSF
jgi:hypothetical protein